MPLRFITDVLKHFLCVDFNKKQFDRFFEKSMNKKYIMLSL